MSTGAERAGFERYMTRDAQGGAPAAIAAERAALGSDYRATGYTPVEQADLIADRLRLGPGDRLLDIGSGCGWPGLHIAQRTGCDVVVTDLTVVGVTRAASRIRTDGLESRAGRPRRRRARPPCRLRRRRVH